MEELDNEGKLKAFAAVRKDFEAFLATHREFVTQIVHKFGSGSRSVTPILKMYRLLIDALWDGQSGDGLLETVRADKLFKFLVPVAEALDELGTEGGRLGRKAKSASFIREAMVGAVRCHICGAMLHNKSIASDHVIRKEDGGLNIAANAMPTHPYCNSTVKN